MKVSDVICKWYIWAVVGYVIGIKLNDTLGGVVEMLKYYPLAKPKTYYCLY